MNLKQVDVIMSEVGEIEDEVFKRRKSADDQQQVRSLCSFAVETVKRFGLAGWAGETVCLEGRGRPLSFVLRVCETFRPLPRS